MARTLVIGLTESGTKAKVNEDSFSCGDRVYPDMITGSEEQTRSSADYTQLYIVTQGFGGSGAGDLAGRILQRISKDFVAKIDQYKIPDLDFNAFSVDLIQEAHNRIIKQIIPRDNQGAGVSFAMLLIDANVAYILNVGDTNIHLFRDNELFSLIDLPPSSSDQISTNYVGDRNVSRDPKPNAMKRFDLITSDVILLSSSGFHKNFNRSVFEKDISSPDAFAANIRLTQIHSRQADNTENGTILAIKVRDLELAEPSDVAAKNVERFQIYHGATPTSAPTREENKQTASEPFVDHFAPSQPASKAPVSAPIPDMPQQVFQRPYDDAPSQPMGQYPQQVIQRSQDGASSLPRQYSQARNTPPQSPVNSYQASSPQHKLTEHLESNDSYPTQNQGDNSMSGQTKMKKRNNWKTFGLSLLMGFLIGMSAILITWYLLIR